MSISLSSEINQTSDNQSDNDNTLSIDAPLMQCPNCKHAYRVGELVCPNCGFTLDSRGKTQRMENDEMPAPKIWPTGEVSLTEQKPVIFEIDGHRLTLPIRESLTIGRDSNVDGDPHPDVSLNEFDAEAQGVSRQHIKVRRKGNLIYLIDLGSTNGTFLNGRRMIPNGERLLRDGDRLLLSHLRITVRF